MHTARTRWSVVAAALVATFLSAVPAIAKSYSADRYDSVIRVLPDGSLDVTETVVFRFEDGTFTEVFREIPRRRTDGIEVTRVEMQGAPLPFGTERGTVEVRQRSNGVRVIWRFGPTEGTTREFVLNYRVRGVVRKEGATDLLAWRATPGEHRYAIGSSTIRFELPVAPADRPGVTSRKTDPPQISVESTVVRIHASNVRPNGWIDTTFRFAAGAVIAGPPAWQQHAMQVEAQSGTWIVSAALIAVAGLILLAAWRQSYETPTPELRLERDDPSQTVPPDALRPAVAGVLASNGRSTLEHAMAALFWLADHGEIEIQEKPKGVFGQRDFTITRRGRSSSLAGYELAAIETIFKDRASDGTVSLGQARSRLSLHPRRFAAEMTRELQSAGFLDQSRKALRDRYNMTAIWLLIVGILGFVPAAMLIPERGGWTVLVPAAVLLVALAAVIFAATITPLSNEGVLRSARWRAYRRHLTAVARGKQSIVGGPTPVLLPYAIALGLAGAWSKYLKHHAHGAPAWFHALPGDDRGAFTAFVAAGGAGAHGGGGATGGGAAAGGGASGAH